MVSEVINHQEFRSKLFMYTTLAFVSSLVLQFGGMWLISMVDDTSIQPRAGFTVFVSSLSIIFSVVTIVGSAWLLASRQILSKKLSAILYILITLGLIAFSCLMIAFSDFSWG